MLGWLRRLLPQPAPRSIGIPAVGPALRLIRGKYDAAATTEENRRHWKNADELSANAASSPDVRRLLRSRARYEVANNSYARGITLTLANDVIATGPRLQVLTPSTEINRRIEQAFSAWAHTVRLAEKLRTLRLARATDGETFLLFTNNPAFGNEVQLDLRLVEAEHVSTPDLPLDAKNAVDGIVFDPQGNPVEYHLLRQHPGDGLAQLDLAYDRIPASVVIHYFRTDRPGQSRGIPDVTPALPLFAHLRRYTLAVITAAEVAALPAGVLYTDAPANGEAEAIEPMDTIALERGMLMTMPGGWKMGQMEARFPTTTYSEFKREILNEISRCLNMPYNVAAANSASYNYASGRLDHQTYDRSIRVDQHHLEETVLDRILLAWLSEARLLIPGLLPLEAGLTRNLPHTWFWQGREHVDPQKEANAQSIRLASNTTTLADEYARRGLDWETQLRQRAKEVALMRELGLSTGGSAPEPPDDEDDEETDDEDADEPAAAAA